MIKNKIIIITFLLINFIFGAQAEKVDKGLEDALIMQALYYEGYDKPEESAKAWKKLFKITNKDEYLIEYFNTSLRYKNIKDVISELRDILRKKRNKELYELLTNLYIEEGSSSSAIRGIDMLENEENLNTEKLYQLAYFYLLTSNNKKALEIYKKIYEKDKSWDSLERILVILSQEKKLDEVKEILWKAINENKNLPTDAYLLLVGLIDLTKEVDKGIFIFQHLYDKTKDSEHLKQLIGLLLHKEDYNAIVDILEGTHFDDKLLYEIYSMQGKYEKAIELIDNLYKETGNPNFLFEKGVSLYEMANSKKSVDEKVLNEVLKIFEEAFKKGIDSDVYYNYYGYILISHQIDIKKGIEYIKKALEKSPEDIYYLDSLAWGYYKLKDCTMAKNVIEDIKEIKHNITEEEMIRHINIIEKSCRRSDSNDRYIKKDY